jgi:4-amino-4-deoxy-L-arabinose transferase-like glycosyltransferase
LLALSALTISKKTVAPPVPDEYENYAYSLAEWGIFAKAWNTQQAPPSDIGRAPLYPLFLAGLMEISSKDLERGKCLIEQGSKCPIRGGLVPFVQLAIAAASVFLIYEMALMLGANALSSVIVSAVAASPLLSMAYEFQLSEAIAVPLFGLASYLLMRWFKAQSGPYLLLSCGVAIGLLALTRVAYAHFALLAVAAVALIARENHARDIRTQLLAASMLAIGYVATVAPWYARNVIMFDQFAIGESGTAGVLAMRASYNRMTLSEGMAGVVYVLPGFGDELAQAIFPEELWSKFDYSNPESFRQQGWALLHEKEALHNDIAALKQSLTQEMLRSPLRHALASIPLAVDGLRYVFWLLPFALVAVIPLVRRLAGNSPAL